MVVISNNDPASSSDRSHPKSHQASVPKVTFNSTARGGLPGGDYSMACEPSTSGESATARPNKLAIMPAPENEAENDNNLTPKDENGHRYVGLVNQAMTCYLNSLLQTLYMTPEFRNAIYEWEYTRAGGNDEKSIPCQLQKLFLLLQTSDADSLETKELTNAFGWSSNEAYDQHDVQELCRLMFDALEMRWKGTRHEKLVEQLYRGTMEDFVKCLTCGRESVKPDVFLDLPLAVRPFGATEAFKSVEEALGAFVGHELMDGANQYSCDNCKSKQDAHKGLRITGFPYLLTIQLKRFDFDYTTFNRIKLNDRVSFPDLLDLNQFVYKKEQEDEEVEQEGNIKKEDTTCGEPTPKKVRVGRELDEDKASQLLEKGAYVYELFSVMVHQGNAAGGHYFAYIKNLDQGKWYCFNDTRVEIATPDEVEKSFGGTYGGWTNSNTNAYMLMYRQVRKDANKNFLRTLTLPAHITNLKSKWKKMEEEKEAKRKYEETLVKCHMKANGPKLPSDATADHFSYSLPREKTIDDLYAAAFKYFVESFNKVGASPPTRKNSRLVHCNSQGIMVEAFTSPADMTKRKLSSLLPSNLQPPQLQLKELYFFFDMKDPKAVQFTTVERGATISAEIFLVNVQTKKILPPFVFPIPHSYTVERTKAVIGAAMGERDYPGYRVILERATSEKLDVLDNNQMTFAELTNVQPTQQCKLYVDAGFPGAEVIRDRISPLLKSLMFQAIDRNKYDFQIRIIVPTKDELEEHVADAQSRAEEVDMESVKEEGRMEEGGMSPLQQSTATTSSDLLPSDDVMSSVSSTHSDDLDAIAMSSGSMTNNTPQGLSPAVSENGEASEFEHSQLVEKMASLQESSPPPPPPPPPPSYAAAAGGYSGSSSAATSGAATLVPDSNSTRPLSANGESLPDYDVNVLSEENNHLVLNVDSRSPVGTLKGWLAERYNIDVATFGFNVCYGEDEKVNYESGAKDEETLYNAYRTVKKLVMKLRPALREDEKMIKVYRFEQEELDRDKWRLLFEVASSKESRIEDIRTKCIRLFKDKYQENLKPEQLHFRCLKTKKVELGLDERLGERGMNWHESLYVHVIPEERLAQAAGGKQAIFIRRFRPSSVEVDAVDYVFVDPSKNMEEQAEEMRCAVAAVSHIPPDWIQFADGTDWERWPFVKQRMDLLETIQWTDYYLRGFDPITKRVGHRVLYYREKGEEPKKLTEEEKKAIRIKDRCQNETTRRKERALRIQMHSVSES